ncbi:MAG: YXWGXW repeat-containing protein [Candidatus Acidiferrales bacterium]
MRKAMFISSLFFAMAAAVVMLAAPAPTFAQVSVGVSVGFAPPELPVYEQPECPGDGYIWTPGYWAWDGEDYYWVPGTWVEPPEVGFFWTPAWWGWEGNAYAFHAGYWGPQIGFYGGINYGFGYFGHGYEGGRWDHGHFFYNRAVNNVNVTVVHNVYETRVENREVTRVSYNGGHGGIDARATSAEEAAEHERHVGAVEAQTRHMEAARNNRELRASVNHGKPPVAATAKPGEFKGHGAVEAKEGSYNPPARNEAAARNESAARKENGGRTTPVHPNDLPAAEKHAAPNTGNAKLDQKYQQQQARLDAKQAQDRTKLQQQQDREHQQLAKQNANDARKQQVEQRHQQQTQQMVQRHTQQQQHLQQHQQPAHEAAPKKK